MIASDFIRAELNANPVHKYLDEEETDLDKIKHYVFRDGTIFFEVDLEAASMIEPKLKNGDKAQVELFCTKLLENYAMISMSKLFYYRLLKDDVGQQKITVNYSNGACEHIIKNYVANFCNNSQMTISRSRRFKSQSYQK